MPGRSITSNALATRTAAVATDLTPVSSRKIKRLLLVVGGTAVMRHVKDKPTPMADWIGKLSANKPFRLVSAALANKLARIAWVVLTRKEAYGPYQQLAA